MRVVIGGSGTGLCNAMTVVCKYPLLCAALELGAERPAAGGIHYKSLLVGGLGDAYEELGVRI